MTNLKATTLWLLYSLGATALAHPDSKLKSLTLPSGLETKGLHRRASDTCSGDCVTCFGKGYQPCSSLSSICFKPGDAVHGQESCSGTGSINVPSVPDICFDGGCSACFGSGEYEGWNKTCRLSGRNIC